MPSRSTTRVRGYSEFQRALSRADRELKTKTRATFRKVGDLVKVDWQQRLAAIDPGVATGLRTKVRTRGISVEQTQRRTTGTRPDFGGLQARRGSAALEAKQQTVEREFDRALDEIADHFNR